LVKKRSFLKKNSKKNPIPSHTEKSFTISILKKKKIPNYYYYILALFVILPNSTLSVFNKKQQYPTNNNNKRINKHTKNNRKTPFT